MDADAKGKVVIASCSLAVQAVEAGADVVVVMGSDAGELGRTIAAVDSDRRVAVFLGDPRDETELQAAITFAAEQFGDTDPQFLI